MDIVMFLPEQLSLCHALQNFEWIYDPHVRLGFLIWCYDTGVETWPHKVGWVLEATKCGNEEECIHRRKAI